MASVLVLVSLSLAVLAIFALGLLTALRRRKTIWPPIAGAPPLISICVPARNEEENLDACLASLRAQDYPHLELIVVDDRSTDQTGAILARHAAEDPRIAAIRGEEPLPGWFGKPNALRQAIARARGEWLLLTDADTTHAPSSARSAIGYALEQRIAALSILPRMICASFWSKLLAPQLGALLMIGRSTKRINDPRDEAVFGNGSYFLIRRDAYEVAGGLAAVKDALDEDVAFARRLKSTGLGYHFVEGESLCAVRFYSTLGEFFAGFGRNFWSALEGRATKLIKITAVLWLMSLVPITTAIVSAIQLANAPSTLAAIGLAQYGGVLAIQMIIRAKNGFPAWMALLAPLGGMIAWAIFASSAYRGVTGQTISWKGRAYAIERRAEPRSSDPSR